MTGLYADEVTPLIGQAVLEHVSRVILDDGAGGLELTVSSGRVEFDEDRSPRITADLELPLEAVSTYEALDPRIPARVAVIAGYRHPLGWRSEGLLLDGRVVDRAAERPDGTVSVSTVSAEQVVIDAAATKPGTSAVGGTRATVAKRIINLAFATGRTFLDTTGDVQTSADPDIENRDKWTAVQDIADQLGADIYDRGDGVWIMAPRVNAAGTPVHVLTTGPGATVTRSTVRASRTTGFANRVSLVYEYTTAAGAAVRFQSVRDVLSGPFAAANGNVRTYREVRDVPTNQTQADQAAANLVTRTAQRGLYYEVEGPSAYWLRPGDTVTLDLPAGGDLNLIVSRVAFNLGTGLMDLALRVPDAALTVGAPV